MPMDWQSELAEAIDNPRELLRQLDLDEGNWPEWWAPTDFPLRVTRAYVARMRRGDANDPLLRQVLPLALENREVPGFSSDPVGDLHALKAPAVLRKYAGRALFLITGACAIHCRYCFRRDFPYAEHSLTRRREAAALRLIAEDASIREIILSGGDPLSVSDARLAELIHALAAIPHLQRLRIHSRLPVVLPSRIHPGLLETLTASRLPIVLVIHANHANELDAQVAAGLRALRQQGVLLLNQAVLLRGVNDSVESLIDLSESLFAMGVQPYYLHLLDRARGTAHFEAPETEATILMEALRRALPGYLVPRLVREEPGAPYKRPIA